MTPVTEQKFFAVIGPLDVHPRVDPSSLNARHHKSTWEIQSTRRLVGESISDSWGVEPTQFFLSEGLAR